MQWSVRCAELRKFAGFELFFFLFFFHHYFLTLFVWMPSRRHWQCAASYPHLNNYHIARLSLQRWTIVALPKTSLMYWIQIWNQNWTDHLSWWLSLHASHPVWSFKHVSRFWAFRNDFCVAQKTSFYILSSFAHGFSQCQVWIKKVRWFCSTTIDDLKRSDKIVVSSLKLLIKFVDWKGIFVEMCGVIMHHIKTA